MPAKYSWENDKAFKKRYSTLKRAYHAGKYDNVVAEAGSDEMQQKYEAARQQKAANADMSWVGAVPGTEYMSDTERLYRQYLNDVRQKQYERTNRSLMDLDYGTQKRFEEYTRPEMKQKDASLPNWASPVPNASTQPNWASVMPQDNRGKDGQSRDKEALKRDKEALKRDKEALKRDIQRTAKTLEGESAPLSDTDFADYEKLANERRKNGWTIEDSNRKRDYELGKLTQGQQDALKRFKNADYVMARTKSSDANYKDAMKEYSDALQALQKVKTDAGWDDRTYRKYLQYTESAVNETRRKEQHDEEYDTLHDGKHDRLDAVVHSAESIARSPITGIGALAGNVAALANPDKEMARDTNSIWYEPLNRTQDTRGIIGEDLENDTKRTKRGIKGQETDGAGITRGKIGRFLYDTLMSTGDSTINIAAGGALGLGAGSAAAGENVALGLMGASAYGSALEAAQARGLGSRQAQTTAAAAGLIEVLTEKLPTDKLLDAFKTGKNMTKGQIAATVLKQAGLEGAEEAGADVLNLVADTVINSDKSEMNVKIRDYEDQGMSHGEAVKQAWIDFAIDTGKDALSGAISGGLMAGGTVGASKAVSNMTANDYAKALTSADDFRAAAESVDDPSTYETKEEQKEAAALKKNLEEIAERIENGEEITQKEKTKAVQRMIDLESAASVEYGETQQTQEQEAAEQEATKAQNARVNRLLDIDGNRVYAYEDVPEDFRRPTAGMKAEDAVRAMGEATNAMQLADAYNEAKKSAWNGVADLSYEANARRLMEQGIPREELDEAKVSAEDAYLSGANGERASFSDTRMQAAYMAGLLRRANDIEAEKAPTTQRAVTRNGKAFNVKEAVVEDDGTISVRDEAGNTIPINDLTFRNEATATIYREADALPTVEAKKAFFEYLPVGIAVNSYARYFNRYYNAGRLGRTFEDTLKVNGFLTKYMSKDDLKNIYNIGAKENKDDKKSTKTKTRKAEGKVIDKRRDGDKSDPLYKVASKLAGVIGQDIVLSEDLGDKVNGEFSKSMAKITLNVSGDNAWNTLFHECAGEFLEAWNKNGMQDIQDRFIDYFIDTMGEDDFNRAVEKYQSVYEEAEGEKSFREAANELINDAIAGIFSTESGINDFVDWLDVKSKPHVLQRITDYLKDIIDTIKEYIGRNANLSDASKRTYHMAEERAASLRARILSELEVARENYEKAAGEEGDSIRENGGFLTDGDLQLFLRAGGRKNKNRLRAYNDGKQMIAKNSNDIKDFFDGDDRFADVVGYGKVSDRIADDIKKESEGKLDVHGYFLELERGHTNHAKNNHIDTGDDSDVSLNEMIDAITHINDANVEKVIIYPSGEKKVTFLYDDGKGNVRIIETVSKSTRGMKLRNIFRDKKSSSNTAGSKTPNTVRDESASINSIPPEQKNATTKSGAGTAAHSLNVDSEGNSLSEGQQEYFKDSKIREEEKSRTERRNAEESANLTTSKTYTDKALSDSSIPPEQKNATAKSSKNSTAHSINIDEMSNDELDARYEQAVKEGDQRTINEMVRQQATRKGYNSPMLYHGTQNFGFTQFDLKKMDDGKSIFVAEDRDVAESYVGESKKNTRIKDGIREDLWSADNNALIEYGRKYLNKNLRAATDEEIENDLQSSRKLLKNAARKLIEFVDEGKARSVDDEELIENAAKALEEIAGTKTGESENYGNIESMKRNLRDETLDLLEDIINTKLEIAAQRIIDRAGVSGDNFITEDGKKFRWTNSLIYDLENDYKHGIYELYGKNDNIFELDALNANWDSIQPDQEMKEAGYNKRVRTRDIAEYAHANGYDGARILNVKDSGGRVDGAHYPTNIRIYFNSGDLKSADPVVYDDNGNVIPLSERFNDQDKDLRFSLDVSGIENDSEGNSLSKGQQDYFKDSKIRDGEGHLMPLYHQTDADFTIFDTRRKGAGASDNQTPFGIFMKSTPDDIGVRGSKQMKLYANITNPLEAYNRDDLEYQMKRMIPGYADIMDEYDRIDRFYAAQEKAADVKISDFMSEWVQKNPGRKRTDIYEDRRYNKLEEEQEKIIDRWGAETNQLGRRAKEVITSGLKGLGYDGVIIKEDRGSFGRKTDAFIALSPEQVKNTDNRKPTKNSDIRFSLSVDLDDEFMPMLDDDEVTGDDVWFSYEGQAEAKAYSDSARNMKDSIKTMTGLLRASGNLFKGIRADASVVQKVAKDIRDLTQTDMPLWQITDNMQKIFDYMQSGDNIDFEDMVKVLSEVSEAIISQGGSVDPVMAEKYNEFLDYLRVFPIKLTDADKAAIRGNGYRSVKEFTNRYFGRIGFSNKGSSLDGRWSEIVEQSDGFLQIVGKEDQIIELARAVDEMKPQAQNDYGESQQEAAYDLAMQIMQSYYEAMAGMMKDRARTEMLQGGGAGAGVQKQWDDLRAKMRKEQVRFRKETKRQTDELVKHYEEELKKAEINNESIQRRREELIEEVRSLDNTTKLLKTQLTDEKVKNRKLSAQLKRVAEQKAQKKDLLQNYKEMQDIRKEKESIIRTANRLIPMIDDPTNKKHVPESMREPLAQFLLGIDFVPHRAKDESENTRHWMQNMQRLSNYLAQVSNHPDEDASGISFVMDPQLTEAINDFIERNGDKPKVSLLSANELHELATIMRSISSLITRTNEAFMSKRGETIAQIGGRTVMEARSFKEKAGRLPQFMDQMLNVSMLDARSFFEETAGMEIYDALHEGQNIRTRDIKKAGEYASELVKGKKINEWRNDEHTFHTDDGDITLTTGQIMSLYRLMEREQAREHITIGGIKQGEIKESDLKKSIDRVKGKKDQKRPVHVTGDLIAQIVETLTPEQKKIADDLQKYMAEECAKDGNEVTMRMYGYRKFTDKNYFPIRVDSNSTATTDRNRTGGNVSMNAVINMSMTKNVTPHAKNAVMIDDIFSVYVNHCVDMATYHGMAMPLADALRWFNYKEIYEGATEDGEIMYAASVKEEVERLMGKEGKKFFEILIEDLNGMSSRAHDDGFADALTGAYKGAAIGANLRVAIQQPTSYLRASMVMDPKYLMKAMGNAASAGKYAKKAQENSALAWWKSQGFYETSMGHSMEQMILGESTTGEKIKDKAGILAQAADDLTWGVLYRAAELEVSDTRPDLKKGSDAYTKEAVKRFEDVIDQTQVVDTSLHRAQIMRSKGTGAKMITSFMSEPLKYWNMLHRAFVKSMRTGNVKPAAKAMTVYILGNIVTAAAAAVIDAFRRDDDETPWDERWMEAAEENAIDNINPIGMIPWVKDVYEIMAPAIKGESAYFSNAPERMDIAAFTALANAITAVQKDMEKGEITYKTKKKAARAISQFSGIPAYNVWRTVESIHNAFSDKNWGSGSTSTYDKVYTSIEKGEGIAEAITERLDEKIAEKIEKAADEEVAKQKYKGKTDIDRETVKNALDREVLRKKAAGDIKGAIRSKYKDRLAEETAGGNGAEMKNRLIQAFMKLGMTQQEANKYIDSWYE